MLKLMSKPAKDLVSRGGEVVCPEAVNKEKGTVFTAYCKEKCPKYRELGRTEPDKKGESYRTVLCEGYFDLSDSDLKKYKDKQEKFFQRKDAERTQREASTGTEEELQERLTHPHNVNDL